MPTGNCTDLQTFEDLHAELEQYLFTLHPNDDGLDNESLAMGIIETFRDYFANNAAAVTDTLADKFAAQGGTREKLGDSYFAMLGAYAAGYAEHEKLLYKTLDVEPEK